MITATATLTMLDKAYKALPEDQKSIADAILSGKWYKNSPIFGAEPSFQELGTTFDKSIGALVGEMIRAFKADVTVSEKKKKSKSGVNRSVIVKLIKAATKANIKESNKYTNIENGRQTYCDGIFLFSFPTIDDTLPLMPENLKENAFKAEKLFGDLREQKSVELELPSLKLLENYSKNNSGAIFSFGYDLPSVNAKYLVTAMKAVPGAKFYMTKTVLMPIYGIDEDGNEVALCPIRTKEPMQRTEV